LLSDEAIREQFASQQVLIEVLGKKVATLERAFFEHCTNVSNAHKI